MTYHVVGIPDRTFEPKEENEFAMPRFCCDQLEMVIGMVVQQFEKVFFKIVCGYLSLGCVEIDERFQLRALYKIQHHMDR